MDSQTALESFSKVVADMLKRDILPNIVSHVNTKYNLKVTVDELAEALNLPLVQTESEVSFAGRRVITKKSPASDRKCIFPKLKGKNAEEGKTCGKRCHKNDYFCPSCIGKPTFNKHAPAVIAKLGKTWKEVMGDVPEPPPAVVPKRKGRILKQDIPVRNPGLIAPEPEPEPEQPVMHELTPNIFRIETLVIYCEDNSVEEPDYVAIGMMKDGKVVHMDSEHEAMAKRLTIDIGKPEKYEQYYDEVNNKEMSSEDGPTEDGPTEDGPTEDGPTEDGQEGPSNEEDEEIEDEEIKDEEEEPEEETKVEKEETKVDEAPKKEDVIEKEEPKVIKEEEKVEAIMNGHNDKGKRRPLRPMVKKVVTKEISTVEPEKLVVAAEPVKPVVVAKMAEKSVEVVEEKPTETKAPVRKPLPARKPLAVKK
jgi:hypothetical protein